MSKQIVRVAVLGVTGIWVLLGLGLASADAAPFAYIANFNSHTVSVIDTATNTVVATVAVGSGPQGVAVDPTGRRVYVPNAVSNTVSVLDTETNTAIAIDFKKKIFRVADHKTPDFQGILGSLTRKTLS